MSGSTYTPDVQVKLYDTIQCGAYKIYGSLTIGTVHLGTRAAVRYAQSRNLGFFAVNCSRLD